jgi:DNA helicase-2/ATP-dependent DNA helicase PcrA
VSVQLDRCLDEFQRTAARLPLDAKGNIVAGAGTGKTTVLVARYMKLVEEDGVPPERLLALTFTLKAAGEMRERVRAAVAARMPSLAARLEAGWIMNFHQFGYRFIQENAPALGIDPGIGVMSIAEFHRIKAVLRARFENGRLEGTPADFGGEPPPPTKLPRLFDTLLGIAQKCRGNMIDPAELRRRCGSHESPAYLARMDVVVALARAWEAELRRRNLLDFDDMIIIPTRALNEQPALASHYHRAFDHILVDEFQDTSRAQNEMLRAIAGDDFDRVTVVGDVKQAIYRWRDARTENITEFPAPRAELLMNYRSVQAVLDLAHDLVGGEPLLAGFVSELVAHRGKGAYPPVLFHPSVPEFQEDMEAAALADWVEYLLGRATAPAAWGLPTLKQPLAPGDIAVVLRKFTNSRIRNRIEAEFTRRGIPYAIVGGASTTEAVALEAWREMLLLLLPGARAVNLLAVLETKPFQVSEASLHELFADGDKRAGTSALLADDRIARIADATDRTTVVELRDGIARLSEASQRLGFRAFLEWAIERTPLRLELSAAGASSEAVDDVMRELHELADTLSRRGVLDLATYLDHLGAELDARKFREDVDVRLPGDRIALMTIHQAKGLEFDAVAVPGVGASEGQSDGFLVSPEHGVYLRGDEARKWDRHVESAPEHKKNQEQEKLEERCVLYVALTRARDHLWVSSPLSEGEKRLKKETRPSFFTDLLRSGRKRGIITEVREPGPACATTGVVGVNAGERHELEATLREWTELRAAAEAHDLGRREPTRPLETVTWASLARYDMCPFAFWLDRAARHATVHEEAPLEDVSLDLPAVELPKGVDPAEFGAFVHAVLEQRDDLGMGLDRTITRVAARFAFGRHAHIVTELARARIAGACAAGLAGASDGAQSELPFSVRVSNVLLHGVIDRLDVLKNGALVTDYKLGAPHASHHFQVAVYAWAVHRVLGAGTVRARLAYIGYDPTRVDEVEPEHDRVGALVDAMGKSFEAGEFTAKPGEVCATCEHRVHCPFAAVRETPAAQS